MAETSGFFNAEMIEDDGSTTYDRIYYADQFAYYFSKFISNGVYINPATQLKVTSKGELKLNVAVGDAFINGYWYKNDENFELQLAQANGSLPRIDRIVLRWDSLTRYINLAILQGNPAATPSAKNLTRNADTWELGLADVYIERGVLSISDANITDLRPDRTYCGYVAGVVNQIDTTNLFAQFTDAFEQYYEKQVTTSDKFSSDLAKKYNDYAVLAETNFGKWMTDTKGDFDAWYETIQAMLSDDEAVKLANQIAELKKQFQLLALRGLKTDLFELASNDGSVFTENAQNAYVFLKQIYGKSELVNDAFISVGESGALEFDSVDATNENVSSAKLTTGMPLRGFIIDDVSVANYTDANGKYWLCDSIELSVDGYWYCIKRVGSILSYNSEDVGNIYKTATGTLDEGKQVLYKLSNYVVSKLTDEEQSQLSELLSYGGGKLPVTTGSNAAEAIQLHVEQNVTDENGVHNIRFRNGSLQYKEGSEWKDITANADVSVATKENAGIVKPDGKSMSVDENGTLSINLDGTTITLDEAKNVIKLADALKDKIGTALQPESIANNQTTTEAGFALDARQANPSIEGTLGKLVSDLSGKIGTAFYAIKLVTDANDAEPGLSRIDVGTDNHNPFGDFWTILLTIPFVQLDGGYAIQLGMSIAARHNAKLAKRTKDGNTWSEWSILSDVSDGLNGKNFFKMGLTNNSIYENNTRVVKISDKLFLCQGFITTNAEIKQGDDLFSVSQQNPFTNLILVNPVTNLSYSVLANVNTDYKTLQIVNANMPAGYYYVSGFLIDV